MPNSIEYLLLFWTEKQEKGVDGYLKIPTEILESDSFKTLKKIKKEELVPFDIDKRIVKLQKEIDAMENSEARESHANSCIKLLDNVTPLWISFKLKDENLLVSSSKTEKTYRILWSTNHRGMGKEILDKYHIERFPQLLEGAMYDNYSGSWRYFGKNEMLSFAENYALKELEKWGLYDEKFMPKVSRYVKQSSYNGSYPKSTPFDLSKPELVAFRNGTFNMLTGKMQKKNYKDYILTAFDYSLDMTGRPTPASDKLFDEFLGESALFMKQFIGYMFYRSHAPAQDMVFLKGEGGEGKSGFLNIISENYLGIDNRSALTPQELSKDKFTVVELLGMVANICGDIDEGYVGETAVLKRLTGGDPLKGEYKGIQSFTFINYAKLIFSMNEYFAFKDLSRGFAARLNVVPITVGDQRGHEGTFWDNQNLEAVKEEAPAFVYGCIEEFRKVFNGKKAIFTKTAAMEKAKQDWLFDNDRIGEFLIEACEILPDEYRGEIASVVYKEFIAYLSQNGYQSRSAKELTKYLRDKKAIPKVRSRHGFNDGNSNQWRYKGLKLVGTFILE